MSSATLSLDPSCVAPAHVIDRAITSFLGSAPAGHLVNELVDVACKCVESVIPVAPSNATQPALPTLLTFVEQVVHAAKTLPITLLSAIAYLDKIRLKLPIKARGNHETHHRMFLASLILSTKYLYDVPYKNKHWAAFSRVFGNAEVNLMESQFLKLLDYNLEIHVDDIYVVMNRYNLSVANSARRASLCRSSAMMMNSCTSQYNNVPASVMMAMSQHPGIHHVMSNAIASNKDAQRIASMMKMNMASDGAGVYSSLSGAHRSSQSRRSSGSLSSLSGSSPNSRRTSGSGARKAPNATHGNNIPALIGGCGGRLNSLGAIYKNSMQPTVAGSGNAIVKSFPARIELSPGELEVFNEFISLSGSENTPISNAAMTPVAIPTPITFIAPAPMSSFARPLSIPSYQLA